MATAAVREETDFFPSPGGDDDHAVPGRRAYRLVQVLAGGLGRLRQAPAALVIVAVLATLGIAASPFTPGGAFGLESKANALNARWNQMVVQGVPDSDLAGLRRESAGAERTKFLSAAGVFWWPDAGAIIDRWQQQTDLIWVRNISLDRSSAIAAETQLHFALGAEPAVQRKGRLGALAQAVTPADFLALRFGWDLETKLVPVDRKIAAEVGTVTDLAAQAKALGIVSDPAAAVLADANRYTFGVAQVRVTHAGPLMAQMTALEQDLRARVGAATATKASFGSAADQIALASAYGVTVSGYQAQVDSAYSTYAAATTAAQFDAITSDMVKLAATVHDAYLTAVANSYHIIYGVRFYYQAHSLSCEETAVSMALTHQGIYLSQDQILAEMGADTRPMYVDGNGVVRWANPYLSFAGNVNGSEHNYTGYQANYPPLVRVARAHGATVIAAGSMSPATIYAEVIANHPVVAYATWDWAWHPRHDYLSFDGQWIPWIGPYYDAHVYTVIGVNPCSVLVNDPIRGQYWVSKPDFEAAYSDFGEAIVFA
jgi:uncharacterized protein YvpB